MYRPIADTTFDFYNTKLEGDELYQLSIWLWPASELPKNAETWAELHKLIKATDGKVTHENLNYAANALIARNNAAKAANDAANAAASEAAATWLNTKCSPGLKGPDGKLLAENWTAIVGCIEKEFNGQVTVDNLASTEQRLTERKQLRWTSAPPAPVTTKPQQNETGVINHAEPTSNATGEAAWKEWLATKCPPALKDAAGNIGPSNTALIKSVITNELAGRTTVDTIDTAARLLKSRNQLVWASQPLTVEELERQREEKELRERLDREIKNRKKTPEREIAESEAEARKEVGKIYDKAKADPVMQKRIENIIKLHVQKKLSPILTRLEVKDMVEVYYRYAYPPGRHHADRDEAREKIVTIMRQENEYSARHPEAAAATWKRIKATIEKEVLRGVHGEFERSVR
jgi:hypothetical protein